MHPNETESLYEAIGGEQAIRRLVEAFYPRVYRDPDLSPLFPDGVDEIKEKQRLFLTQFTGGPPLYSIEHGAPRMRERHLAFPITPRRAKAWLRCMKEAMTEAGLAGEAAEFFYERLTQVAGIMVNTPDGMEKRSLDAVTEFDDEKFTMRTVHRMGDHVSIVLGFMPGQQLPAHRHPGASVFVLMLEGEGAMTVNGETISVTANDSVSVDGEETFSFRNTGDSPARLYLVLAKKTNARSAHDE